MKTRVYDFRTTGTGEGNTLLSCLSYCPLIDEEILKRILEYKEISSEALDEILGAGILTCTDSGAYEFVDDSRAWVLESGSITESQLVLIELADLIEVKIPEARGFKEYLYDLESGPPTSWYSYDITTPWLQNVLTWFSRYGGNVLKAIKTWKEEYWKCRPNFSHKDTLYLPDKTVKTDLYVSEDIIWKRYRDLPGGSYFYKTIQPAVLCEGFEERRCFLCTITENKRVRQYIDIAATLEEVEVEDSWWL